MRGLKGIEGDQEFSHIIQNSYSKDTCFLDYSNAKKLHNCRQNDNLSKKLDFSPILRGLMVDASKIFRAQLHLRVYCTSAHLKKVDNCSSWPFLFMKLGVQSN